MICLAHSNVFFSLFKCTICDLQVTAPEFGLSQRHSGFAEVAKARHSSNEFGSALATTPLCHFATLSICRIRTIML